MIIKKAIRLGLTLLMSIMLCGQAAAETERQYKVEAAFLYNFLNYVTWPGQQTSSTKTEAKICLYDGDVLLPYLNYIAVRKLDEIKLSIQPLPLQAAPSNCDVIYFRNST
ncbi:MAG: YfiR family protein, partial [Alphaproteobacteria bacterium]|nr:YfiR family protein [Alphaproteobacteria bacterium]